MRRIFLILALTAGVFWTGRAGAADVELLDVRVKPGDTPWSLSNNYLKDPKRWDEIVKRNAILKNDPTVVRPGMTLKVPTYLIKEEVLRSGTLVELKNRVHAREREKVEWREAKKEQTLYHGDTLRTYADSWARVQFFVGGMLSVDANSMAILKSPKREDHDLYLSNGSIHATKARIRTPSALIVPKSAQTTYAVRVKGDQTTQVQVLRGLADVLGGGKTLEVKEGFTTDVPVGRAPAPPAKIPNFAQLQANVPKIMAPAANPSAISIQRSIPGPEVAAPDIKTVLNFKNLEVGVPIAAYRLQVSQTETFEKVVFERTLDIDERLDSVLASAGLHGRYWIRAAFIDLLGEKGKFSPPRQYVLK
ncbi:MAG: LysM peptidoglycan-binding domain-containing protein [Elusimicrobia bacterium]|nr:LysM peptidoglycan-binding domain-containing protein [Elusimicrobiota bacterium]